MIVLSINLTDTAIEIQVDNANRQIWQTKDLQKFAAETQKFPVDSTETAENAQNSITIIDHRYAG